MAEKEALTSVTPHGLPDNVWETFVEDVKAEGAKTYILQVKKTAVEKKVLAEKKNREHKREDKAHLSATMVPPNEVLRRGLKKVLNNKLGSLSTTSGQLL